MSTTAVKVWFVTGASSGLGRAIVTYLLEKGDKVVATLRKPNDIVDLVLKYPKERLLVVKLDVVSTVDIKTAFSKAIETFGRIDVVYNNAGFSSLAEVEGTSDEVGRGLFEVNFWGATNVSREAVHVFRDVNKPSGGRLLQASSMVGIQAMAGFGYYSASKHALEGISQALALELNPSWNITITIIQLGSFHTKVVHPNLAIVPTHRAYTAPDSATYALRQLLATPDIVLGDDPDKAAREIRNIGLDAGVGLRVPFGISAIEAVSEQLSLIQKDLGNAVKWSSDLKFDA